MKGEKPVPKFETKDYIIKHIKAIRMKELQRSFRKTQTYQTNIGYKNFKLLNNM
jgi:hypothetical protein